MVEGAKVHQRRVINKTTGEVSARPAAPVSVSTAASQSKDSEGSSDALDKSLSSAFFQNLRKGSDPHAAQVTRSVHFLALSPSTEKSVLLF